MDLADENGVLRPVEQWQAHCAPTENDSPAHAIMVQTMDRFICYSPDDMQVILEWVRRQTGKNPTMMDAVGRITGGQ
jgi:hypothetical protein